MTLGRIILAALAFLLTLISWFASDFGFAMLATKNALSLIQRALLQGVKALIVASEAGVTLALLLGDWQILALILYLVAIVPLYAIVFALNEVIAVLRIKRLRRLAGEAWERGDRLRSLSYQQGAQEILDRIPGRLRELETNLNDR